MEMAEGDLGVTLVTLARKCKCSQCIAINLRKIMSLRECHEELRS